MTTRTRKTRTGQPLRIGLLLPRNFKFYNHEAVEGMVTVAARTPELHFVDLRFAFPAEVIPRLKAGGLDALITGLNQGEYGILKPHIPPLLPAVNIHPDLLGERSPTVRIQLGELARKAVDYLCGLGYRRLACVGTLDSTSFKDYASRMMRHAAAAGASCEPCQFAFAKRTFATAPLMPVPKLERWLGTLSTPVAITATGGYSASLLNDTARRLGLNVPDDVAILSLSDDEPCLFAHPPISAFRSVGFEVGKRALEMILDRLRGKPLPSGCIEIPPPGIIIERGSTGFAIGMDERIKQAVSYLRTHACDGITVGDVLRCNPAVSRSALFQEVKRFTGRTPAGEIRRLKIERAQHLLAHGSLPLGRVAEQSGFASNTQFSITFRQVTGMTPSAWRRRSCPGFASAPGRHRP